MLRFDRGSINKGPIDRMVSSRGPLTRPLKTHHLIILGTRWVYRPLETCSASLCQILTLGTLCSPSYDHFLLPLSIQCHQPFISLLMELCKLGPQAASRAEFWSFIIAMWVNKSEFGYTTYGRLTFCEFVDFRKQMDTPTTRRKKT